jgi:hypothetical protein
MNIPRTAARPPRRCGLLVLAAGETEMAFGKRRGGADFLPILKYDARNGSFYLQDRVNRDGMWETEQTDVTTGLRGIFDLETVEVGWIKFPKGGELPVVKLTNIVEKKNGHRSIVHTDVRDRRLGPTPGRHAETIAQLDERPAPTEAGAGGN